MFFSSEKSKLIRPGYLIQYTPESTPVLPIGGAKKHAALMRLKGSLDPVLTLQPWITPMRAPSVFEPVIFTLPAPETLNPGVKGWPVRIEVTPETCQPLVKPLVKKFPRL